MKSHASAVRIMIDRYTKHSFSCTGGDSSGGGNCGKYAYFC